MTHTARPQEEIAIIELFKRKIKEIRKNRVRAAKVKKDSHPRYTDMTDEDFKRHKLEQLRYWMNEEHKVQKEFDKFRKDHIVYE